MIGALLGLLRPLLPYFLIAGAGTLLGGVSSWQIQGVRIDNVRNEFHAYKLEQTRIAQEAENVADEQRKKAAEDYYNQQLLLDASIKSGEVFRRCVAAGKCGRVSNVSTGATGVRLPPSGGTDAPRSDAVPATAGDAEGVAGDCATTTLMLNRLQISITEQQGYAQ